MTSCKHFSLQVAFSACLLAAPAWLVSAELRSDDDATANGGKETVEMFAAMQSKEIEVKIIPRDDKEARVFIKNKTDRPLTVKLPDAFAMMPVLAQGRGGGGGGGNNNNNQGGNQAGGGGMGGGGGMMGGGMGMMSVPAEKVAQFKVATVCLEHGKKEPRPAVPYEIKPIESFSAKPEIKALLTAFGKQKLNQRATQAAAWHLSNGMSWEQLAEKHIDHLDGTTEMWFSPQEIQAAMQISQTAVAQAELEHSKSPGELESLNTPIKTGE